MNRTTRTVVVDDPTTAILSDLDAAQVDDGVATGPPAQAALARILATDPARTPPARPRRPRHTGRWAVAGVAVLAGGVFAAVNLDESSSSSAFASWTPTPVLATPANAAVVGEECRRSIADSLRNLSAPGPKATLPSEADVAAAQVVLAETRGRWTLVVVAGRGIDMTCLAYDADGHAGIDMTGGALGLAGDRVPRDGFSSGGPGVGSTRDGSVSTLTGTVGADVTALEVTTADGRRVAATISGNRFAAWWPGAAVTDPRGPAEAATVSLTLRDGRVRSGIPANTLPTPLAPVPPVRGAEQAGRSGGGVTLP